MGKGELVALLNLSSWCLVMVEQLFLAVPRGCLRFVIVVFPDHIHKLFLKYHVFENFMENGAFSKIFKTLLSIFRDFVSMESKIRKLWSKWLNMHTHI